MNQLRERFGTFLARARAGALPATVGPAAAPPAEFLAPTNEEPGAGELTIHYADADLALVSRSTADGTRRCGVVGVDPFRTGGTAGIPVRGGVGSLTGVTRDDILTGLGIDSWVPLTTANQRTLQFGQCRRLQGWAAVKRITFGELEEAWQPGEEHANAPIICNEFSAKEVRAGNQTIDIEAACKLNCYDAAERRSDPTSRRC